MDNKLLTIEVLDFLEPHQIFATGHAPDSPEGINMSNSGKTLKWVAVRGTISDWTIYCHFAQYSAEFVSQYGDKVCSKDTIRKLVPCTDEVYKKYRF